MSFWFRQEAKIQYFSKETILIMLISSVKLFHYYNFRNQLFCKLTSKHVNKQSDHVQLHFNGRRFQKAYKHCKIYKVKLSTNLN